MKLKEKKKMMNKPEFVALLAERCEVTKAEAEAMYDDVFGTLSYAISSGEEVAILNVGRAKIAERAARVAHNPKTKDKIEVPAKKIPKFQFSKNIKESVAAL